MYHKKKLKFEDYKNCLEAAQIENKIYHFEKNEIDIDSPKEFIKKIDRLILKTQPRFKSEKHNVFAEEINKIALSLNDGRRMQSIDSIETCIWNEYVKKEYLVCEKEGNKCNNLIKQYKNV